MTLARPLIPALLAALATALAPAVADEPPGVRAVNPFGDPFVQVTSGLAGCPPAAPPSYGEEEVRALAHDRAQRGTSCWLAGRCRLHNAYLYDAEIVPRARQAIVYDGRWRETTALWVLGQRRHVWLQGCVQSREQARDIVALLRLIDDVEDVHDQTMVGTAGVPPYPTR